jgi:hypothetical protein
VRAMGRPMEDLAKQKIVVVGAGRYNEHTTIVS